MIQTGLARSEINEGKNISAQHAVHSGMNMDQNLEGKPLKIDENSFAWERGKFVRICIKLDFSRLVKHDIWIGKPRKGLFQCIRYERFSTFCFKCDDLGHQISSCPQGKVNKEGNISTQAENVNEVDKISNIIVQVVTAEKHDIDNMNDDKNIDKVAAVYGPWIRVNTRNRRSRSNNVTSRGLTSLEETNELAINDKVDDSWEGMDLVDVNITYNFKELHIRGQSSENNLNLSKGDDLVNVPNHVVNLMDKISDSKDKNNSQQFDSLVNKVSPSLASLVLKGKAISVKNIAEPSRSAGRNRSGKTKTSRPDITKNMLKLDSLISTKKNIGAFLNATPLSPQSLDFT
ncbi:hypothetical protein Cni_G10390 [Canna indica]|uniref:CCHC-type domain-containing protein n=1 Tax=Canna indica TaxID=4628 RepID=A0AAQ3K6K0_9LILI|nr:hypothetical protein Cni_G10390 [Canna indica]